MKKSDVTYICGAIFASLTAVFYCCVIHFKIAVPRYYPLEHVWKMVNEKGVPSQGWYGLQLYAFLTAGLVTLVVYLLLRQMGCKDVNLRVLMVPAGVVSVLLIAVSLGWILCHEFGKWGVW